MAAANRVTKSPRPAARVARLNPRFAASNNDALGVWVVSMIETAESAALRANEPAALKRYQLQTAEMVRQRIAVRIWEEGKAVGSSRCSGA